MLLTMKKTTLVLSVLKKLQMVLSFLNVLINFALNVMLLMQELTINAPYVETNLRINQKNIPMPDLVRNSIVDHLFQNTSQGETQYF